MEYSPETVFLHELYAEARKNTGWIKFLGILLVIAGILTAILLVGFLVIWIGMILIRAANALEREGVGGLEEFVGRIGLYFKVYGIMTIVAIVLYFVVVGLVFSGSLLGFYPPGIFT